MEPKPVRIQRKRTRGFSIGLTPRELEVLTLCAHGLIQKEIGKELCVARDTVKNHFSNILAKLGANHAAHAVYLVFVEGKGREDK